MKAVVYRIYGSPDVLHCEDVEEPSPGDDEVLIRVRAAAVNPLDCHFMSGVLIMRPMIGLFKPKMTRPGTDLAGEVEAVGRNVTRFRVGDPVFGVARGAFAEYVCASENRLAMKPANLTFEQAAAIPVAASTALQGLRDRARLQPGQQILINGDHVLGAERTRGERGDDRGIDAAGDTDHGSLETASAELVLQERDEPRLEKRGIDLERRRRAAGEIAPALLE